MRKKRKHPESEAPQLEPRRITPVDIQQKEFRLAMRGYNERDVDQFLDEVTEEVARLYADNKRLREEVEFSRTTRLPTTDAAEAEAIIRRAREEASRIIAEASARACTMSAAGDPGQPGGAAASGSAAPPTEIMSVFLARERAFLQNMANLIQAHAEGVKQDVRRVRDQVVRQTPGGPEPVAQAPVPEGGQSTDAEAPAAESGEETDTAAGQAVTAQGDRGGEAEQVDMAPPATDEPTQAWDMRAAEAERADKEASPRDIVDLTRSPEEEEDGRSAGQPSGRGAVSRAKGPNRAMMQTGPAPRPGREGRAGREARPGVEDEDAREDRSLRELFWGEE